MEDFRRLGDRLAEEKEDGWSSSARPSVDDLPPQSEGCKPNPERVAAIRRELRPGKVIPVAGNPAKMSDDDLLDAVDDSVWRFDGSVTVAKNVFSAPGEFVRTPTPTKISDATTVSKHIGEAIAAEGIRLVGVGKSMQDYGLKDSGVRQQFDSGMVRDTNDGKIRYDLVFDGPMLNRYAIHLTKGAIKYAPRNWMLANNTEEMERFKESAVRHFMSWMQGLRDEDHAAAVWYNVNGFEYVRDRLIADGRLKEV
jgi:Domain of unknown function (DUF5664)